MRSLRVVDQYNFSVHSKLGEADISLLDKPSVAVRSLLNGEFKTDFLQMQVRKTK